MRARPGAALGLAALLLTGCGSTNPDSAGYREQASLTLGTAVSEVQTTRLTLREYADGSVFRAAVTTQLRYSEDSLGRTAQSFESLNPPAGTDALHGRCSSLLGKAEDLLAEVRIAVHRDDRAAYAGLVRRLGTTGDRLDALEKQVSS